MPSNSYYEIETGNYAGNGNAAVGSGGYSIATLILGCIDCFEGATKWFRRRSLPSVSSALMCIVAAGTGALVAAYIVASPAAPQYRDTRVLAQYPAVPLVALERVNEWSYGNSWPANASTLAEVASSAAPQELVGRETEEPGHTTRAEESLLFSALTNLDADGLKLAAHDDRLCLDQSAGKPYDSRTCMGAPYLYVTFHGGYSSKRVKNVCKFTRDGCSMGSVLAPSSIYQPHSLRGLLHHDNYLLVAEAWKLNSKVLRYSHCNPSLGHKRELLEVVVDQNTTLPGMVHPYGFASHPKDGWVYVSAQDTFQVLRFNINTGDPAPLPRALETRGISGPDTQGVFVDLEGNEVRGLAFDAQGLLYVANKQRGVEVFDREGFKVGVLPEPMRNVISIHYCRDRSSIWVGSARSHALFEFDVSTWQLMQRISHRLLKHPAGFASHGDFLYVVSQEANKLLKFSMLTGELVDIILERLTDAGERLLLSPC